MRQICPSFSLRLCAQCGFFVLLSLLTITSAQAQRDLENKRPLDHVDYDRWNTIVDRRLSNNGSWVLFSVRDGKAEPTTTLKIRKNGSGKEYSIDRATGAKFTFDSQYVVYRIQPDPKKLKQLKKAKAKPDQYPKTVLEVLNLGSGNKFRADRVKTFLVPRENGRWLAYHLEKPVDAGSVDAGNSSVVEMYEVTEGGLRRPEKKLKLKKREPEPKEKKKPESGETKPTGKTTKTPEKKSDEALDKKKASGTTLVLHDLNSGFQQTFPNVVRYSFSKNGNRLAFVTSVENKKKSGKKSDGASSNRKKSDAKDDANGPTDGVFIVDLKSGKTDSILTGLGEYKNLSFNEEGSQLAFITNKDDYATKTSRWSLYHWRSGQKSAAMIADEGTPGIPEGWWVSPVATMQFSEDGKRLYFDTAPVPESVLKERKKAAAKAEGKTIADDDDEPKAKLDIWHWQDPLLQPQQLLQAEMERRRSYRAAYNLRTKKIAQLATLDIPSVRIDVRSKSNIALASSNMPYRKMLSWDMPGYQDAYLINLDTGKSETIIKKSKASGSLSPSGKFVTWFDAEDRKWYAVSTGSDRTPVEISKGIEHPLQNELHDTPSLPRAYGSAGWLENDDAILIYDRFDVWQLDPTGKTPPSCLTQNMGRENSVRFRVLRLEPEARFVEIAKPIYLSAFDEKTKASGFYRIDPPTQDSGKSSEESSDESQQARVKKLIMLDEQLSGLSKARDSENVIFTRSTFRRCPDVWSSKLTFEEIHRISDINPQQDEYRWGTAELVHWNATDGQPLDGLLYKPDGFDPNKKYPLMVYFYERNSDTLHRYYEPAAGRSIINHSFYVSRGYLLFVPDIPYKTGEPGPSAANAILPGVEHLIEKGFVDKAKIGMQGHSWGGYQTAYLVTQTDMFACAESGAPVSNMTSAYGGIRWGSGMSRMFQYERTQSRIGQDLWSAREKYIANSPLFFADKINTPLLILHNDEDGAVPWYQGIELFVALRRLEKPAWLLNYNAQPHWVMKQENRRDFATRMQQFFDHYLMDAPEPEWMAKGVPAVDKGKKFGLELLEPKKENSESAESETAAGVN